MSTAPFTTSLAHRIREARYAANLSQVEAAAEMGVSPRTWQGWESGRTPRPRHRRALVAWFARVADSREKVA